MVCDFAFYPQRSHPDLYIQPCQILYSMSVRLCLEINQLATCPDEPVTPTFMSELTSRMQRWYVNTTHHFFSSIPVISVEEAWATESELFRPLQLTRPNLFDFIQHMFLFQNAEFCPTAAMFGLVDVLRYAHKLLRCTCNEDTVIAAILSTDVRGIDCFRYAHEEAQCIWSTARCTKIASTNSTTNQNSKNCLAYIQQMK